MTGVRVGVDIASVSRVAALVGRSPRFVSRVFTDGERRHCHGRPERWASRWAAKEAVRKLAGGGDRPLPAFRDVEVVNGPRGAPSIRIRGWNATITLSLSHDADSAVAVAILVSEPLEPLLSVPGGLVLAPRSGDAHKGTFGTVVVLGGSVGFSGAPYLAAMGAARAGAGLVRVAVPGDIYVPVAGLCVEVMVHPVPVSGDGAPDAEMLLDHHLRTAQAAVIGPGLSTASASAALVTSVLGRLPCPAVVDAGGLNIAAEARFDWSRCPSPLVLTPHPAEMGRLLGITTAEVQHDRRGQAAAYARRHGVTVVLKGSGTVVAAADGRVHTGPTGLVALATGGTGDVLGGVIAALVAQGLQPFDAAVAAVTIHAEAAAEVQARRGRAGALATDLLEALPQAQERLRRALQGS